MSCEIKVPKEIKPSQNVLKKAQEFIGKFKIFETVHSVPSLLYFDNRSSAFYLICHVDAKEIAAKSDSDAVLDPNDNEDYKLNRNLYTDTFAYKNMEDD
ncbi:MAG: hypothetical protein NTV89_05105, partial [Proteobacteria bacterium]|nr:hypothetical protein [Pseudomonadota bacterium]